MQQETNFKNNTIMKKFYTYMLIMLSMMAMTTTLTSCESDDQYEADLLIRGDWQGYLGTYYRDRWGLAGNTYETVIHFVGQNQGVTSGMGYEVDYDTRSPFNDYAYCEFQWSIVNGRITLIYEDSQWNPVYIYDYRLTGSRFYGYMDDGTTRNIRFDLTNVNFGYWSDYRGGYYYSRQTRAAAAPTEGVPYVNNGKSICSGSFVRK